MLAIELLEDALYSFKMFLLFTTVAMFLLVLAPFLKMITVPLAVVCITLAMVKLVHSVNLLNIFKDKKHLNALLADYAYRIEAILNSNLRDASLEALYRALKRLLPCDMERLNGSSLHIECVTWDDESVMFYFRKNCDNWQVEIRACAWNSSFWECNSYRFNIITVIKAVAYAERIVKALSRK